MITFIRLSSSFMKVKSMDQGCCACVFVCVCVYVCARMYPSMCVCVRVCMYVCVLHGNFTHHYINTQLHARKQACTHIHVHTNNTHTHTHTRKQYVHANSSHSPIHIYKSVCTFLSTFMTCGYSDVFRKKGRVRKRPWLHGPSSSLNSKASSESRGFYENYKNTIFDFHDVVIFGIIAFINRA